MQKHHRLFRGMFLLLIVGFFSNNVIAQEGDLKPVTNKYAIKNATIVQAPGQIIENGAVLIENGLIKAVGTNISIPADAWVVNADSMFVYAGFISGLSNIGVEKPKEERKDLDEKLTGNPPNDYAGITPERSAADMLQANEKTISSFRQLGFTASHTVAHEGMLPGTGSIILLNGKKGEEMLYKEDISMFSQFDAAKGVYPNTVIGVMAKYRDLYRKASQARDYSSRYNTDPAGMERPDANSTLEALYPVVDKQMPVIFKAESIKDIMRVKALQQDLNFTPIYGEVKQGWDAIPTFKALGSPIFLSLDYPEWKEEDKKEDLEKKNSEKEDIKELSSEEIEANALKARKMEMIKNYYTQAGIMSSRGVQFGFSTMEVKSKNFKTTLMKVIEYGLSEDQALAALTTQPARILGLSNTMGTIEAGKIANLIVSDTAYFNKNANVRYVFVDGMKYKYEAKERKKKKSNGEEPLNADGVWSYSTETPQGEGGGTITISGSPGNYSGTMTLSFNDSTNDMENIEVDGNTVSFSVKTNVGEEITIDVSMTIDEDTFEGTLSVAEFGSFPMEGSKEPEN
ncbi:MAG: amidohydrolase family protein [Bacteroidota bacterium]